MEGYEACGDSQDYVKIHQLLAIAEGEDPEKVFSNGEYVVHHKNHVRWDNRAENIELMTNEEHTSLHAQERDCDSLYDEWNKSKPWFDEERLRKLYHEEELSTYEISERLGCSQRTIVGRMKEFNIDRRSAGGQRRVSIPRERLEEYIHNDDLTQQDIADEYNTTRKTIYNRLREAGL